MIGAYVLSDASHEPLYVGSSRNIERRIREHMRGSFGAEIADVWTQQTECWQDALDLERCLIFDLTPRYNRQGVDPLETAATLAEFAAALGVEASA